MMKFSLVRTDKKNETHLSVKTAEWFMERILTDTKAGDITKLRQHLLYEGNASSCDASATMVYPRRRRPSAIIEHNRNFEVTPPALQYFNDYFDIAEDENEGQWLTATAIYDHLRSHVGSGLKANGVAAFGRYLRNLPGLQHKRVTRGMVYLVKEK